MSWCCFGARRKHISHPQRDTSGTSLQHIKLFTYSELRSATDNFHPSTKIGRGGFGIVYKGILRDGTPIAAKVLSAESGQGVNEFLTEIDVITNVKHPNLVELLGCCVQGNNRILVYEYVDNSSLDRALLGSRSEPANLDWAIRSEICVGTARGLAFLHEELEPHIVHRDIKASNILLGKNYAPKIGDFGLAKLFPDNVTHISTRVAGTTGYLAPEYAMRGQLTKKADIYSFGVLVLEIVSGRSSSLSSWSEMDKFLLEWAWQLFKEGRLTELVDPTLTEYPEQEVIRYMKVALFCTQAASGRRPTMSQVVEMLSRPLRLKDEALTPPGLVAESTWKKSSGDTGSGSSLIKDPLSEDTTTTFNSTPVTFTEFIPR